MRTGAAAVEERDRRAERIGLEGRAAPALRALRTVAVVERRARVRAPPSALRSGRLLGPRAVGRLFLDRPRAVADEDEHRTQVLSHPLAVCLRHLLEARGVQLLVR